MNIRLFLLSMACVACVAACSPKNDGIRTRGIGVYPGDPAECFAPQIISAGGAERNLALRRAASHSSSFNFDQTAQLVTDGIVPDGPSRWVSVTRDGEPVSRIDNGYLTDHNMAGINCKTPSSTVELRFNGYQVSADRIMATGSDGWVPAGSTIAFEGECEGEWIPLGTAKVQGTNQDLVGENDMIRHHYEFPLGLKVNGPFSAVRLTTKTPADFTLTEVFFYKDGKAQSVMPNVFFTSSWKSYTAENEWVTIDLGAPSRFGKMKFCWVNGPAAAKVQVSDDSRNWKDIAALDSPSEEIEFPSARGRYVRLLLEKSVNGEPFELGEWEVIGTGGVKTVPAAAPAREGSRQMLCGGAWKIARASETDADGAAISSGSFDDASWMCATVPGTVLGSYVDAGAVLHPNYAANQLYISDSYFRSDFWYRDVFDAVVDTPRQLLHFEGVNWKAEVWLNGTKLGLVDGAFRAEDFDVTGILKDGPNCLAVKIICNDSYGFVKEQTAYTPDKNGGILGADNPTMHATIGWDWLPTVRGRGAGIYDDVWLSYTGPVTISEPFVRTVLPLPDTTSAKVYASAVLVNRSDAPVNGTLEWNFGELKANRPVELAAGESLAVEFPPQTLDNPRLWWPRGYGEQNLYPVSFSFKTGGTESDRSSFLAGVRQMSYSMDDYDREDKFEGGFTGRDDSRRLSIFVNGRRFIGFGGNWGYPEHLLNYRAREYDAAVAYHADMNFTMIRDWVGMIGSRHFYEACDLYGIMIWQDFWLANPWDGPEPSDPGRFNEIARSYVHRIRNHPSIALYVGRNEGYPPKEIDSFLETMIPAEHPGMFYIPHSAADGVSGGGPYNALQPSSYFHIRGRDKLHSEMGMPNVMNWENLVRTMGEDAVEPVNTIAHPNAMYGLHDYTLGRLVHCAQQAESFNELIASHFGEPADAKQFASYAQWVNYDGYRAMFEGRGENRRGLLLWMSHPAWPSMVWQTYDYFLEPTAAYFGCKKACEPLHIQLNQYSGIVEAVNYHAKDRTDLTAKARVLDMQGQVLWENECTFALPEDATFDCFPIVVPDVAGDVYYVKLTLCGGDGTVLSDNFYVQGREEGNFQALNDLGRAKLSVKEKGGLTKTVTLTNSSSVPALMIRLRVTDSKTGDLVLPVMYSDNYFSLMPGESKTVTVSVKACDCSGKPVLDVTGFNL